MGLICAITITSQSWLLLIRVAAPEARDPSRQAYIASETRHLAELPHLPHELPYPGPNIPTAISSTGTLSSDSLPFSAGWDSDTFWRVAGTKPT